MYRYTQVWGEKSLNKLLNTPQMKAVQTLMEQTGAINGDLTAPSHWGKTADGRIVCLDYGLSDQVYKDYYGW